MEPGLEPDEDVDKVTCPSLDRLLPLVDTGHREPCLSQLRPFDPCLPAVYHWVEMRTKMRIMGFHAEAIKPLNEDAAAELGANLLGETIIFATAGSCLLLEFWRQKSSKHRKEVARAATVQSLREDVDNLEDVLDELQVQVQAALPRNALDELRAELRAELREELRAELRAELQEELQAKFQVELQAFRTQISEDRFEPELQPEPQCPEAK
ncbi:optic atrophy 3 protein-like [Grammomys surdaster]|uniref:optic atrophy 3 protein-like n=1 Tax=Grammomys surdaster TaxID=491861 RepID=UPI00109F2EC4|nr:optic atrophy 3 protein-like [Grammomys surdaster]